MSSDYILQLGLCQIQLLKGDITTIAVDAIVNAANSALAGGGGVDGAIHHAGGPSIMAELDVIRAALGRCEPGNAVVTTAGNLPAKFVIHAVGPRYIDGSHGEAEALRSCYETSLRLAAEHSVKTISFPSISTGIYGYPMEEASEIAIDSVATWLREQRGSVTTVKLVQFSERDHQIYRKQAEHLRNNAHSQPLE